MNIEIFSQLLAGCFPLGLLLLPWLWFSRSAATRRVVFWLALLLINLGGWWFLLVSFLITRLNGSRPPSLLEVLGQGLWVPLLILLLANLAAVGIKRLKG